MNIPTKEKMPFLDGYYEGDVVDGKPHGKGEYHNRQREWDYEGDFVEGKMTGKGGKYSLTSRLIYEGDFVDGKYHGKGKLDDEYDVYEGDFVNGYFHGKGKMTYANGKIEEGNWEYDKFMGK